MDARVKPAHDAARVSSVRIAPFCTIAFLFCRGTRWLVRSLYFPVFLQIRNLPSPVSRSQAHTPPPSRGAFLRPGFASLLHRPRIEGWAERRETFGCSAEHPWGVPSCVKDARQRAFAAARQ